MSANVDSIVREGVAALKAGRKDEARLLLMKAVEVDQHHEEAWLYLSGVVETEEDQQTCLENVLAINPANERARKGLQYLEQKQSGVVPAPPPPRPAAPPPPPSSKHSAEMSTSVEWAAPADEPAPAPARKGMELSDEDYDQWVTGLNLPAGAKPPFTEDDDEFNEPDEDAFKSRTVATPLKTASLSIDEDAAALDDLRPAAAKVKKEKPQKAKPQPKMKPEPVPPPDPLFPEIPNEVRATRLPGTNERVPLPLIALVLLLVVGNIAAVIVLVQSILPAA